MGTGFANLRMDWWLGTPLVRKWVVESYPWMPPPAGANQIGAWNWLLSPTKKLKYNSFATFR